MPTPVSVARQCLADAAAAVLDDAVTVAKRRGHGQTTSLHAVSALLALPSSALREACARARSSAYSPRLQFRALELCVGVALDRISVSKTGGGGGGGEQEAPPVSNSLMAAIKRSQANQRRHPETFHLYQFSSSSPSISAVKVELKHFVMSILDDPIVSRVFDDAGFRTHEIKLAVLNPLTMSRFSSTSSRPPPLFLCNLRDFDHNKPYPNFPFPDAGDDNSRRISEILLTTNRRKNPLLIGACAGAAYRNFTDSLTRGDAEHLPKEINGLKVASIEHSLSEFINGAITEDSMKLKLQQLLDGSPAPGILAACGDLKMFIESESSGAVGSVVAELKKLLTRPGSKLWLIGYLAGDDDYTKLVKQLPCIEQDLDFHLLPITTSTAGKCFKSSLMKSFVPFGGFFPIPSELESPSTTAIQSSKLCNSCNEKCELEVDAALKGQSGDSGTYKGPGDLSSCLQITGCKTSLKTSSRVETKEDKALLDARILGLRRKWNDICQRLHCTRKSKGEVIKPDSHTSTFPSFRKFPNLNPCVASELRKNSQSESDVYTSSRPVLRVTTDLRLGTIYNSAVDCGRKPDWQDSIQNSESSRSCEKSSGQVSQSPSCSHNFENYVKDLEQPWKGLAEKVYWQAEAVRTVSETISRFRTGSRVRQLLNGRNVWLAFSGLDIVGKRKIAASVAEILFGKNEHFIRLNLDARDMSCEVNSVIDCYDSQRYGNVMSGRKTIVDHLAEELRMHPHSVVLLENVEKADFLVQQSLLQAVKTGKFRDSYGRDINISNAIFVLASTVQKRCDDPHLTSEFPEEKIREAQNLQMQISVESARGIEKSESSGNVLVSCKRKYVENDSTSSKRARGFPRSVIDLNLPVVEENSTIDDDDDDNSADSSELIWLEELLGHVDENVLFKPFDFDALYSRILKDIDTLVRKAVGVANVLEIHEDVMAQMLAAGWVASDESALRDWIEHVLCRAIREIGRKRSDTGGGDSIVKLMPCDGAVIDVDSRAPGSCLPARINLI
ncbi:protein SMAX1-LIKE 6-like [Andrographis paniculata]|uniref:protein SMAX1-LIKE 6-like n=1 Tax=Andrographis paniculata TaxID=175694 RepID=UPI0021E99710|nr:protein SMAX1-LIKE 6-like [Andrographis paniculata]